MIKIFYKDKSTVVTSENYKILAELGFDDVVWVDLIEPEGAEKRSVEDFLEVPLQTKAKSEEIESSSRYYETDNSIYANTNFLIPGPDEYSMETVSFIICEGILVTTRQVSLRSLNDIQRKVQLNNTMYPTGYHIFVAILENRIDLDADMIEIMAKELDSYSKKINGGVDLSEDFLLDINQLQENTMLVRENVVDKQRMVSSIMKSDKFPRDVYSRLNLLIKDIDSLLNHTSFSYERLDYMQNTVLGLINLDQNKIMKTFTFVSLLFMPPTLLASIYGMNVKLPLLGGHFDFILILLIMLFAIFIAWFIFKKRRML